MKYLCLATILACCLHITGCHAQTRPAQKTTTNTTQNNHTGNPYYSRTDTTHLNVPNAEWKKILPKEVYSVAREQRTEYAFSNKLWNADAKGIYYCAVCGNPLFRSTAKFATTCGWPSFYESISPNAVLYKPDNTYGMSRIEVACARCNSHLGHIFDDGPEPTGKRFCMNGTVLEFEQDIASR
jgi:peptide-methionine (R)-S-oxide reductase